jgi:alkylated DNA repair protein alkB family protein 6
MFVFLQQVIDKVLDNGGDAAFGQVRPNHVLLNEYLSGQGISPHLDGDLFYPTIATVSLGKLKKIQDTF